MIHFTSENLNITTDTAVCIGKFDGVHRGHIALIDELKRVAQNRGLSTVALTFAPHPIAFFSGKHLPLILDPQEKIEIFNKMDIDYYVEYKFDHAFAQTTPEDFLHKIVAGQLRAKALVVAEGYRFGKGGAGDVSTIKEICKGLGIEVSVIGHVVHEGHKISSDYLRKLITEKDFGLIKKMLGREFSITGRTIGQTLNMRPHADKILPQVGEYTTTINIGGKIYESTTTVTESNILETRISDFDKNINEETIVINFK
ncbi:MAG: hypothetical protein FWC67_04365 [Defluviitaleaceae bacterium]|nr:hypothetical protein [Defluviitaleaceae bacterium]